MSGSPDGHIATMKTTRTFNVTIIAMLAFSAVTIGISRAHAEQNSAQVQMELTARLVTLDGAPAYTAAGAGTLVYESFDGGATLKGGSVPKMVHEADVPPEGFEELTVEIAGVMGVNATIEWPDFPDISIRNLSLKVRAYASGAEEAPYDSPICEFIVRGIELSTDPITVNGVRSGGYIDVKKMEAQLAGKVVLPDCDLPEYSKHLAGEPIILEALLRLKNPFKKK